MWYPELMMMKRSFFSLVVCVLGLQAHARTTSEIKQWFKPHGNGNFSLAARNVCKTSSSISGGEYLSPNHLRKIVTRFSPEADTTLLSAVDEDGHEFAVETEDWSCPEIGWSPTSTHFFVTYSDDGAVGTYHVSAYSISAGRMKKLELTGAVRQDFQRHYPKCDLPEEPNIAGVAWSVDSTKLLIAAQVLPHSNCDNMGTFTLYTVAVSNGSVIDRIPQLAAKASLYDVLGQELRAADDGCLSNVGSCWIPGLHQSSLGK